MPSRTKPVLLCFDGSSDAAAAIVRAGTMLAPREAVVLTVWQPVALWEPYDPATVLSAPFAKLASDAMHLDHVAREIAQEKTKLGEALATEAGFRARGWVAEGKAWRTICDVASKLDAEPIVVGARGLGRIESALLGSVSSAVVAHAGRPVLVVPHLGTDRPARA